MDSKFEAVGLDMVRKACYDGCIKATAFAPVSGPVPLILFQVQWQQWKAYPTLGSDH